MTTDSGSMLGGMLMNMDALHQLVILIVMPQINVINPGKKIVPQPPSVVIVIDMDVFHQLVINGVLQQINVIDHGNKIVLQTLEVMLMNMDVFHQLVINGVL